MFWVRHLVGKVRLSCEKLSCVHLWRWYGNNKTKVGYTRVLSLIHTADVTNSTVSLRRPCESRAVYTRQYVDSVFSMSPITTDTRVSTRTCVYGRVVYTAPYTPFTRYHRLSNWLNSRLNNRLDNRLDNRLNVCIHVCIHDATGCSIGCQTWLTTGWTTGCIMYTNIQAVEQLVVQPVGGLTG